MEKFIKKLFSTRTTAVLFVIYIIAMAWATFIENDYGTPTAKRLFYNAFWFEILQFLLICNFIGNIKKYQLYKKEKWALLVFHLSFILIFLGGMVSRYIGYEGIMKIREGQTQNTILTDNTYLKFQLADSLESRAYKEIPTNFAYMPKGLNFLNTNFKARYKFKEELIDVKATQFIPRAKDSLVLNNSGKPVFHLVSTSESGRENFYFYEGEVKNINGLLVGFNIKNAPPQMVSINQKNDSLYIQSPIEANYMVMATQAKGAVAANSTQVLQLRSLYSIANSQIVVPETVQNGEIITYAGDKVKEKNLRDMVAFQMKIGEKTKDFRIYGGKNNVEHNFVQFDHKNFYLGYGAKEITTDFAIKLRDFELERYPGSNSPSSYASEVTLIDEGKETNYRIFMNNVLDYKGFRLFQSSYDSDELGTVLSVNHDFWGTLLTYIGYTLLFLGLIVTLFWKGTHFWKLNQRLKDISKKKTVATLAFVGFSCFAFAQHQANFEEKIDSLKFEKEFTDAFGALQVQHLGRMKPMNTLSLEILRKLTKESKFRNLDANQFMLALHTLPSSFWIQIPMLKVGDKGGEELKKLTHANEEGFAKLMDLFQQKSDTVFVYTIEEVYNQAFRKKPSDQSNFDKEVIALNERVEILQGILVRQYLNIIPIQNDPNETWTSGVNEFFEPKDSIANNLVNNYLIDVSMAEIGQGDWKQTQKSLQAINAYQQKWGKHVTISDFKLKAEIFYNKYNAFLYLMILYSMLGGILLINGFIRLFKENKIFQMIEKSLLIILFIATLIHFTFLGLRWYISGHAPWSNGYEAVMFISGIALSSGFILYRNRNAFIPVAGCLTAVILMGFAHGGDLLNPQITTLVPVLKSYWLMIHVAIITSSYGFFGLACLLGMIILYLFIFTTETIKPKIKQVTTELHIIIEMALTIGIVLLTIGTFLGGIWANESWGRYWSWDPKETWAYISIIVYAFVLHMRLVPGLRGIYPFTVMSVLAFSTVIMTYFGVNYYLSGLHSYAAGDPIPIPVWVYVIIGIVLVSVILSRISYTKYFKK